MILNQNVNFSDLPTDHQNAFLQKNGAYPTKELIRPGLKMYKFNSDTNMFYTDRNTGKPAMSPWWSPYEPYKHDGGWENKLRLARLFRISVREWGRLTSAGKEDWNSLAYLLEITLKDPVYGFFGGFAQMERITVYKDENGNAKRDANGNVMKANAKDRPAGEGVGRGSINLPGGGTQFYIPNLTPDLVYCWNVTSLANL
jgi:hypothetical protein